MPYRVLELNTDTIQAHAHGWIRSKLFFDLKQAQEHARKFHELEGGEFVIIIDEVTQ